MADLEDWVGEERTTHQVLAPFPARGMAALLDRSPEAFEPGTPLPPCWHWLYFRDTVPQSELGPDGHERRGAFLPPVSLPRRMWAGGKLRFSRPLRIGQPAERRSMVLSVEEKGGSTGRLVFVTVGHELLSPRGTAVEEEQVLVYREERRGDDPRRPGEEFSREPAWSESLVPDPVFLFRYSALTFNGHRIHYDQSYAIESEGYPERLVHAPLTATLLADAADRRRPSPLGRFEYRATSPLFCGEEMTLAGWTGDGPGPEADRGLVLRAVDPKGRVAMRARAGSRSNRKPEEPEAPED